MIRVVTWNVNSIRARLDLVVNWLKYNNLPDIVLMQEIKCVAESFPRNEFESLGYNCYIVGQKSYNGVAILSKEPMHDLIYTLGLDGDDQARYIQGVCYDCVFASLYLPNGNPVWVDSDKNDYTEKFIYKMNWFDQLKQHLKNLLNTKKMILISGDYNVCPTDQDVYNPKNFIDDAVCRPEIRKRFNEIIKLGYINSWDEKQSNDENRYTYWGYRAGAWFKNNGLRIDHMLSSPNLIDKIVHVDIDKNARALAKPSDHVPLICHINK